MCKDLPLLSEKPKVKQPVTMPQPVDHARPAVRALQNFSLHAEGFEAGRKVGHEAGHAEGYEGGREVGHEAGYAKGYRAGREAGHEAGHAEGFEAGRKLGHEAGHAEGYEAGREAGRRLPNRFRGQDATAIGTAIAIAIGTATTGTVIE
jgi:flagellar biosynthesis/type III secretory pathway protein FliH